MERRKIIHMNQPPINRPHRPDPNPECQAFQGCCRGNAHNICQCETFEDIHQYLQPPLDPEEVAEAALELAQALTHTELPIKQLVAGALALCRFELGFRPDDREALIEQLGIDIREGRAVTPESLAEHTA